MCFQGDKGHGATSDDDIIEKLWSRAFDWYNKDMVVSVWNHTIIIFKGTK